MAGISSIADGNAFLDGFRRDYNARFGRAPSSDHDAHRRLIKSERVRIDDIFSWQESRAVTRSLTLQYDKVIYMIKPGPENDKIAGQHVTLQGDSVWKTTVIEQSGDALDDVRMTVRGGPYWAPRSYVDVVVRFADDQGNTIDLAVRKQEIHASV